MEARSLREGAAESCFCRTMDALSPALLGTWRCAEAAVLDEVPLRVAQRLEKRLAWHGQVTCWRARTTPPHTSTQPVEDFSSCHRRCDCSLAAR